MKQSSIFLLASVLCLPTFSYGQESNLLTLVQTISFPNLQGGFNHMSVDAEHQRLFAAAPANNTVEVVDLNSGKPLRRLEGERPAAVRYASEFNQLYVTQGQSVVVYDGKTLNEVSRVDLQSTLDELQYDPRAKELYVGCMSENKTGIAIIAIPEGKLVAKIPLPAKLQGIAVEQNGDRIFVNMPSLTQIAVIDRKKRVALQPWTLQGFNGNSPIGLDEARHRLFVGARSPAKLVVLDTKTGKPAAGADINNEADDLFYDPGGKRIYISCGEGLLDVIQQRDADHYHLMARVPTVAGARTSTFSPQLKRIFVGVPQRSGQPAEIRVLKVNN